MLQSQKITVLIPTYNEAPRLQGAGGSLQDQVGR